MKRAFTAVLLVACFACGRASAEPYVFAEIRDSLSGGAGYNFSQHFGAEAAYFKHEKDVSTSTIGAGVIGSSPAPTASSSAHQDVHGLRLSAIARAPASSSISILASLSGYSLQGDLESNGIRASGSGTTYGLGLGASYAFSRSLELRAMFDWIHEKKDMFGSGADLDSISTGAISLLYRF